MMESRKFSIPNSRDFLHSVPEQFWNRPQNSWACSGNVSAPPVILQPMQVRLEEVGENVSFSPTVDCSSSGEYRGAEGGDAGVVLHSKSSHVSRNHFFSLATLFLVII